MSGRDEGPVYYREIQKNAFLKRIPTDIGTSKLRPLGHKKPPLKPMWTLFCVHNGRTPFLEQYPEPDAPATIAHRPLWRACLRTARHVTASVKPHAGDEYDFLIDTDNGPVRMLAPDWDSMQDWVNILRTKLHELKIVSRGENVYGAPPVALPARAPARDPMSPLPPTPPVPPDRVPGIELAPIRSTTAEVSNETPQTSATPTTTTISNNPNPNDSIVTTISNSSLSSLRPTPNSFNIDLPQEEVDISQWDVPFSSIPSTSQDKRDSKSVAKICGQNICLDDSILKRNVTDSDEEFFAEIDRVQDGEVYKQCLVVNNGEGTSQSENQSAPLNTNITVIQVSNKGPPHTAIPIIGNERDIFDFNFKQNLKITEQRDFVNIVNTENDAESYGTVFDNQEDYGHLSLTSTVTLTHQNSAPVNVAPVSLTPINVKSNVSAVSTENNSEGHYERLCMASTSSKPSPLPIRRILSTDKVRKSSLPNLDLTESTYEYLFPNSSQNDNRSDTRTNGRPDITADGNSDIRVVDVRSDSHTIGSNFDSRTANGRSDTRIGRSDTHAASSRLDTHIGDGRLNIRTDFHLETRPTDSRSDTRTDTRIVQGRSDTVTEMRSDIRDVQLNRTNGQIDRNIAQTNGRSGLVNGHMDHGHTDRNTDLSRVLISNLDSNSRDVRTNVERSHSQNAYDNTPRLRSLVQNLSPKREGKIDKPETSQPKPIWRRGLTELSLLSRLRGIGQAKRQESPTRQQNDDRGLTSPAKVVHRSRPMTRADSGRRRSNSLSSSQSPCSQPSLQPLRARQAAALRAEQRRGACIATTVSVRDPPVLCDYENQVWIARWGGSGTNRASGRAGDRLVGLAATTPRTAHQASLLLKAARTPRVDILFHRVPLGKIYVITKKDHEGLGIKIDNECTITAVEGGSPAGRAGLPPPGKWGVTEVNNRAINIVKGSQEEINRLGLHGTEVSVLIQPAALVKKMRAALKANKSLLVFR